MGIPAPNEMQRTMNADRLRLRLALIAEEWDEIIQEAKKNEAGVLVTSPELIDGLCDLLYVTYGWAVELGIDLEPAFEAVHEANMKKGPGPVREDGKKLKPEGWEPPDIAAVLDRMYRRQRDGR
jgi:predicted HAD superfamily Cof-like phosphohydrolase